MARRIQFSAYYFMLVYIFTLLISIIAKFIRPWGRKKTTSTSSSSSSVVPYETLSTNIGARLRLDPDAIQEASSDFGNMIHEAPAAVLYPTSVDDIINLVKFSYNSATPFTVAARGRGHSARGQAMAKDGVVVEMSSLAENGTMARIRVSRNPSSGGYYADVGGEQLWIDVLLAGLAQGGVAPVSWTDYLYLTVGGTLSNAGISGQSFKHGPQISNVYELDVVTGKGELVTCSKHVNSELYFAVLGGLGQFGIITRARIALEKAPTRVKWMRMVYDDFSKFTKDQEHLISATTNGVDYVEGSVILHQGSANNWRSSFFNPRQQSKIASYLCTRGIIYCMEVVKYYYDDDENVEDEDHQDLLGGLEFEPGMIFEKKVSYEEFLNRVRSGEVKLKERGEWEVPHPWLNLFVGKSCIMDFNAGVFVDILRRRNITTGPILVYPTSSKRWDDRMSAVIPEGEEIFYCVGFLHSSSSSSSPSPSWEEIDDENNKVLEYCEKGGNKVKQYLPYYKSTQEWMKHFGTLKWKLFQKRKALFDPNFIFSPGQRIFNNNSSSSSSSSSS